MIEEFIQLSLVVLRLCDYVYGYEICIYLKSSGAPDENIVQNHLNIALLNVFYYLNGRYRHIFIL